MTIISVRDGTPEIHVQVSITAKWHRMDFSRKRRHSLHQFRTLFFGIKFVV